VEEEKEVEEKSKVEEEENKVEEENEVEEEKKKEEEDEEKKKKKKKKKKGELHRYLCFKKCTFMIVDPRIILSHCMPLLTHHSEHCTLSRVFGYG
jgi:hypothetical protein